RVERIVCGDAPRKEGEARGRETFVFELRAKLRRVERTLRQAREDGDAVEEAIHRVERNVVQIVAPPSAMRQALAERLHDVLSDGARDARELGALAFDRVARVTGE